MADLRTLIEKTKDVAPIAENNGVKIVSFEEQRDMAQLDIMEKPDLGLLRMNEDGTVAATPTRFAAVNTEMYYLNRYKKVKNSIYVVTDYRAIREQGTGRVYAKMIPAYVVTRGDQGLYLEKVVNVSDSEFIADFTHTLNKESMKTVMPLLVSGVGVTQDDMPI